MATLAPLPAVVPPTEQLVFALAMLLLTLALGCAMGALVFYRMSRAGWTRKVRSSPAPPPAERPFPRFSPDSSAPTPQASSAQGAARARRAPVPAAGTGRAARATPRGTSAANEKQARRFETLLANLERERRQGTVSDPVYRKLRREYQSRLNELRPVR